MTIAASRHLLRPMTLADIPRVSAIEKQSFPTMWPQTAYKRELQRNNLAAYIVLCERAPAAEAVAADDAIDTDGRLAHDLSGGGFTRLVQRLFKSRSGTDAASVADSAEQILGFVGLWFMVDEAHIVTIAVAQDQRRRGLGETLLIAAIELAQRREQAVVTLECRVSNLAAQALYEKYGFHRVGVRKHYYTDNDEDALIMTTFPISAPEYLAEFERLRAAHIARRGAAETQFPA